MNPNKLQSEEERKIFVEMKYGDGNQMVHWGSAMREKRKSRNKMAKNSRRRNRG